MAAARRRGATERVVALLDAAADWLHPRLRRLLRWHAPLSIECYLGYGDASRLRISGRVVRLRAFALPDAAHSHWRNVAELLKRMFSGKQPGARLRARFQDTEHAVVADAEGYFNLELTPLEPLAAGAWPVIELDLLHPAPPPGVQVRAEARVMVPPANARFGVISDIDDTVVRSHVTSKRRMLWLLLRSNAHTRAPLAGVAALYRALVDGPGGADGNPLFYVSSSPWNLYAPLTDYLAHQQIPGGPLVLRDFGDHTLFALSDHGSHKPDAIARILAAFPALRFVLVGDSGEQDPEIYAALARAQPERVLAIYIRDADARPARRAAVTALATGLSGTGVPMVLVADSPAAADHAAAQGLIREAARAAVHAAAAQGH